LVQCSLMASQPQSPSPEPVEGRARQFRPHSSDVGRVFPGLSLSKADPAGRKARVATTGRNLPTEILLANSGHIQWGLSTWCPYQKLHRRRKSSRWHGQRAPSCGSVNGYRGVLVTSGMIAVRYGHTTTDLAVFRRAAHGAESDGQAARRS
jgi:hypothetical protein